jgi:hypothetical protein
MERGEPRAQARRQTAAGRKRRPGGNGRSAISDCGFQIFKTQDLINSTDSRDSKGGGMGGETGKQQAAGRRQRAAWGRERGSGEPEGSGQRAEASAEGPCPRAVRRGAPSA